MELTVKGKTSKNLIRHPLRNNTRLNVFNWQDGFYHVELQIFDGIIWKRDGNTKCLNKQEYEQLKKEKGL